MRENVDDAAARSADDQYSLRKILTLWALATVPMPSMAFVVAPRLAPGDTWQALITVWILMILGMIWQFVLSVIVLRQELESFRWQALRDRLWLSMPTDPTTGRSDARLFWWLIPAFGAYLLAEFSPFADAVGRLILVPFPQLERLPELRLEALAEVPELTGAWWLVGLAVVSNVFNYFLGEELLFRGVLLPRMRGVFGRWDWVANAVLFALYHLHRPVQMLAFIFGSMAWTLPSRRYRSIWFAVILHGLEGIFVIAGTIGVASGAAFR